MATIPKLTRGEDGYWRATWYDDQGKRHRRGFGRKRNEAHNRYSKWLERWRRDELLRNPGAEGPLTIAAAVRRFLDHAETYYRRPDGTPTGEATNLEHALTHVVEAFGARLAEEFTPAMLRAVRENMLACQSRRVKANPTTTRSEPRVPPPLCMHTINDRVRRIRQAWKWMSGEQLVPPMTHYALTTVAALKPGRSSAPVLPKVGPVAEAVVRATCERLPPSIVAMIWLQWWSGARPGEICGLTGAELDTSGELWEYRPNRHKTAHHEIERVIIFGPRAQEWLRPYLRRELCAPCFTPRIAHEERLERRRAAYQVPAGGYDYRITPSYQRRRREAPEPTRFSAQWDVSAYRLAIGRAAEEAVQPHWTPNQLRHASLTRIRRAAGLEAAQLAGGHEHADTTEIYAQADVAELRELMRRYG